MEPFAKYYPKDFQEKLSQLFEKTFDLDDDVNYIWDNYFSKLVEDYKKNPSEHYHKKNKFYEISSSELPSTLSQQATHINPIKIIIGKNDNAYNPNEKVIYLNIGSGFINHLASGGINSELYKQTIKDYPGIVYELEEHSLKTSIYHELSHWVDDSLNNAHIKALIDSGAKKYKDKTGNIDYIMFQYYSPHEINAIIHAIKALKNKHTEQQWNNLTFIELLKQKAQYYHLMAKVMKKGKNMYDRWLKKFFGRLSREGLLGNNMKPLSFEDMKKEYRQGTFGQEFKNL